MGVEATDGRSESVASPVEHLRAAALELTAESVVLTDASGRITYANHAFKKLHAMRRTAGVPHRSSELAADPDSADRYGELEAARARGQAWSGIVADTRRDGTRVELHLTTAPVRDRAGAVLGWIEIGRDVGLEHALETSLRHAAKMLVADRLASVVAHDLNNLLTAISGFARLHRESHRDGGEDLSDLDEILHATDRGASLVRRVLAFSRRSGVRTVPMDVPLAVREAEPLVRRLLGEGIEFRLELEDVPLVLGDPDRIEEILLNLAANSRDAMPDGGTFVVRVSSAAHAGSAGRRGGSRSRRYVVLTVSDSGAGMDDATRARIFDPFFTTKELGKGTGLGLASVWSIVREAGGFIEVESALGMGTTFSIFLPAAVASAEDGEPRAGRSRRRGARRGYGSTARADAPASRPSRAPFAQLGYGDQVTALVVSLLVPEPSDEDAG